MDKKLGYTILDNKKKKVKFGYMKTSDSKALRCCIWVNEVPKIVEDGFVMVCYDAIYTSSANGWEYDEAYWLDQNNNPIDSEEHLDSLIEQLKLGVRCINELGEILLTRKGFTFKESNTYDPVALKNALMEAGIRLTAIDSAMGIPNIITGNATKFVNLSPKGKEALRDFLWGHIEATKEIIERI